MKTLTKITRFRNPSEIYLLVVRYDPKVVFIVRISENMKRPVVVVYIQNINNAF